MNRPCFRIVTFVLVPVLLALNSDLAAWAQFADIYIPDHLAPGLYYYFPPGSQTASIHYVPYPTALTQDPYSKPVKPLPVFGQQNFPELNFNDLKMVTLSDLQRRAYQPSQMSGPVANYRDFSYPEPYQQPPPVQYYNPPVQMQPAVPSYSYGRAGQSIPTVAQHERMLDELDGGGNMFSNPVDAFQQTGAEKWNPQQNVAQAPYGGQQVVQSPRMARGDMSPQYMPPPVYQPVYPGSQMNPPGQMMPGQWDTQLGLGQAGQAPPIEQVQARTEPPEVVSYMPPSGPPAAGSQPSAFRKSPGDASSTLVRRSLRGVPIEQMNRAADLAKKASKLLMKEKFQDACELLEDASAFDPNPNSGGIHYNLAVTHGRLGHSSRALLEFNTALTFEPNMTECFRGIGTCYQSMGKIREAMIWYEKYLQSNPNASDASEVRSLIKAMEKASLSLPADDPGGSDYLASVTANGLFRWPEENLPIKVFISDGRGVKYFKGKYRELMADAFDVWFQASGKRVSWTKVPAETDADIVVKWVQDHSSLSSASGAEGGQTVTVGKRYATGGGTVVSATIYMLTAGLTGEAVSVEEIKRTCVHEVGHALGLKGHSSNNRDIMFFSEGGSRSSSLTNRDIATIGKLYEGYSSR